LFAYNVTVCTRWACPIVCASIAASVIIPGIGISTCSTNSSVDFVSCGILDQKIFSEDTADGVVSIVASIPFGSRVVEVSWSKRPGLQGILRVAANSSDLLSELKRNCLVYSRGIRRGRILHIQVKKNASKTKLIRLSLA